MQRPKRNNNIFKQWVGPLFMITVGAVIAAFALEEFLVPFTILDGLGDNVGESIVRARRERPFGSKEDLLRRTQLSKTLADKLSQLGVLKDLDESDQMSLF